jgi:hypothetical protein
MQPLRIVGSSIRASLMMSDSKKQAPPSSELNPQVVRELQAKNIGFYPTHANTVALQQFAQQQRKLNQLETVDIETATHSAKPPEVVFGELREWVYQSLDQYHRELLSVLWPIFVTIYLKLIDRDNRELGRSFFARMRREQFHTKLDGDEDAMFDVL